MVSNHVPLDKLVRDVAGDLSDILSGTAASNTVLIHNPTSSKSHYEIHARIPGVFAARLYFRPAYTTELLSPESKVSVNRVTSLRANLRKSEVPDIPAAQQTYEKIKQYLASVAGKAGKITPASWRSYWIRQLLTDIATSHGIFTQNMAAHIRRTRTGLRYSCKGPNEYTLIANDGFSGLSVTSEFRLEQRTLPQYCKRLGPISRQVRFE